MRDLLVPIFGEWGAVVVQFVVTLAIVLGLIGAIWWFVRRYSGAQFGGIGRGRVPRLALVDSLQVDRRHRLILVRRDAVEHLLLIGGPSDVVVEGAIQRVRQRGQPAARAAMQQPAPGAAPAAQPEALQPEPATDRPAANQPIPFPGTRSAPSQAAAGNGRPPLRPVPPAYLPEAAFGEEPAAAPVAEELAAVAPPASVQPQRPQRWQPMRGRSVPAPPEAAPPGGLQEPTAEALLPEVMTAVPAPQPPSAAAAPATFAEAEREAAAAAQQSALDLGDMEAPAAEEPGPRSPESAHGVGDLEREMARLLDEITTRRSS